MKKDFNSVFFDTAPLIYYLDHNADYYFRMQTFFNETENKKYYTSAITCTEYLTFPYRNMEKEKIDLYYDFLRDFAFGIVNITNPIADKAAYLRAEYNIKSMDALQIASALSAGCEVFLTNDIQLKRIKEIECLVVVEL